ncbi:MAG: hypothetical protein JST38_02535 [Bacteroidetes bacterium]|nr:hypothetical protein [Bacteroidota bacterium]
MGHLNYFEPFNHKDARHEDQLTRAFLTVLRYSPITLLATYDLVRNSIARTSAKEGVAVDMPPIADLDLVHLSIETQRGSLPQVSEFVSVLISNDRAPLNLGVAPIDRRAVYDGIISFGQSLALVLENKPRVENVWEGQLSPSSKDVPPESKVLPVAAHLSWRDIVLLVTKLMQQDAVGGGERLMMHDLLEFINANFPYLNPFENLALCKSNPELLQMRIESLLKEVVIHEDQVQYHRNWAWYIAVEDVPGIQRIGLILEDPGTPDWHLKLFLGFADTVNQARSFFERELRADLIEDLRKRGWGAVGNFHLSYMQQHLLWYPTIDENVSDYLRYWSANGDDIGQYPTWEIEGYLAKLFRLAVIQDEPQQRIELKEKLLSTNRKTVNVAPGFVLAYEWSKVQAEHLDQTGQLAKDIARKISEGLQIMSAVPDFLKPALLAEKPNRL